MVSSFVAGLCFYLGIRVQNRDRVQARTVTIKFINSIKVRCDEAYTGDFIALKGGAQISD